MITESTMDSSLSPSTSESLLYTLLVFCTWRSQEMKEHTMKEMKEKEMKE